MPTRPEPILLDASAALALVHPGHDLHEQAHARLHGRRLGLAGHATFETFSVLTRLPGPLRLSAPSARRLIETNFPATVHLDERAETLLARFTTAGVSGGSVYDGLVAAAAASAGRLLISGDHRAAETYRALGVRLELLT